jgi:hypothetical protein
MAPRIDWANVLARAGEIVRSYTTAVTLRQLHYRLVSLPELGYPNTLTAYKGLSDRTAKLRRAGEFPPLSDLTRGIEATMTFEGVSAALDYAARIYWRDRCEGQEVRPVIVTEKRTLIAQMRAWTRPYTIPVVPLGGYSSESFEREIRDWFGDGESYRVIYVGDFDPSGEDIERNVRLHTGRVFSSWKRLCVTKGQIRRYRLPENVGKATDSRAGGFEARHGKLIQVEVEALDPAVLERLVTDAVLDGWDSDAYDRAVERERTEKQRIQDIAAEEK